MERLCCFLLLKVQKGSSSASMGNHKVDGKKAAYFNKDSEDDVRAHNNRRHARSQEERIPQTQAREKSIDTFSMLTNPSMMQTLMDRRHSTGTSITIKLMNKNGGERMDGDDERLPIVMRSRLFQAQLSGCKCRRIYPTSASYTFLFIGIIFFLMGAVVDSENNKAHQSGIRYDDKCKNKTFCNVTLRIEGDETYESPIFIYYVLGEIFQNHRTYVSSFSQAQIEGAELSEAEARRVCKPAGTRDRKVYFPCGLKANSVFNDSIVASYCAKNKNCTRLESSNGSWNKKNIAWHSDEVKFSDRRIRESETNFGYFNYQLPNLTDPDLIVWMRAGNSGNISKLYRIIEKGVTLSKGDELRFTIKNQYSIDPMRLTPKKRIVISTTSAIGAKSPILATLLLGFATIALVLSATCCICSRKCMNRDVGDLGYFRELKKLEQTNAASSEDSADQRMYFSMGSSADIKENKTRIVANTQRLTKHHQHSVNWQAAGGEGKQIQYDRAGFSDPKIFDETIENYEMSEDDNNQASNNLLPSTASADFGSVDFTDTYSPKESHMATLMI